MRARAPNQITAPRAVAGVPPQPLDGPNQASALDEAVPPDERRSQPRGRYTKAVHGHLPDEQVVLMGSNLSPQGMQVECEPRLSVGMRLTLDLYGHGEIPPVRMKARVLRDDGVQGLYLEFTDLWPGAPALLERLIKTLPLAAPGTGAGMVISEVVERR